MRKMREEDRHVSTSTYIHATPILKVYILLFNLWPRNNQTVAAYLPERAMNGEIEMGMLSVSAGGRDLKQSCC